MTKPTKCAIEKYGRDICVRAFNIHSKDGEGASSTAIRLGLASAINGNAAINAGREIVTGKRQS